MKNIVENQDIKTDKLIPMSYEALKAKCEDPEKQISHMNAQSLEGALKMADAIKGLNERVNALAVESVALRHIVERIVNNLYAAGYEPEENSLHPWKSLIFDAEKALNTPATDAALAAIRSDYMAEGAEIVARKAQVIYQERHKSGDFESAGKYLTTINFANNIAADIREAK